MGAIGICSGEININHGVILGRHLEAVNRSTEYYLPFGFHQLVILKFSTQSKSVVKYTKRQSIRHSYR
ncbi:hypothetical protein NBRC116591_40800 [Sessilibacter corallicola]|uniref:Uncharacterized protein n=1 Tax=Sessilibacter corallicola TaxID=2904075 RepID=A0ABQ0AF49_9GAMM